MIDFNQHPLVPAIVQDARTGQVLMVAYMNQEALDRTLATGQAWFWSRSRHELWHKGATSGNYLNVLEVTADCDSDTVLLRVDPEGPACHTGAVSCFFDTLQAASGSSAAVAGGSPQPVDELFATIEQRKRDRPEGSYVASLFNQGTARVGKKVVEEAGEAALASVTEPDERLIEEVADLWFHSLILLSARNLTPKHIWDELERRRR